MGRAVADDRSKSNRTATLNAAPPRAGIHIPKAKDLRKPEATAKGHSFTPSMQEQFGQLKSKHPDALLLFRTGDNYVAYKEDAQTASRILELDVEQGDKADTVLFPFVDLDTHLPKLIRAGQRVAICDQLEESKQTVSHENEARVGRGR